MLKEMSLTRTLTCTFISLKLFENTAYVRPIKTLLSKHGIAAGFNKN